MSELATDLAERYLRLALRLGRLDEGVIDAYFGPTALADSVEAEDPPDPRDLVADAEALLAVLDDSWLRDQVVGLRTVAGRLAGEQIAYPDEVEACYGVRPARTDRRCARRGVRRPRGPASGPGLALGALPRLRGLRAGPGDDHRGPDGRRRRGGPRPDA